MAPQTPESKYYEARLTYISEMTEYQKLQSVSESYMSQLTYCTCRHFPVL